MAGSPATIPPHPMTNWRKRSRSSAGPSGSARAPPAAQKGPDAVPLVDLDASVRDALHALLAGDGEAVAALCEERDQRLRAEQATVGDAHGQAMLEVAALEKEIGRLVKALASGASEDVTAAINERRAKVELLKATPALPPPFDRAEFLRRFAGARKIDSLLHMYYPEQARQVLRKLGVTRIVVAQDGVGWAGSADLAPHLGVESLVTKGSAQFNARPGVPVE